MGTCSILLSSIVCLIRILVWCSVASLSWLVVLGKEELRFWIRWFLYSFRADSSTTLMRPINTRKEKNINWRKRMTAG